jgi:hypothetical protein
VNDTHLIEATMRWVDDIVINHNFCPFAGFVRQPSQIHCVVVNGDAGDVIASLFDECKRLDEQDDIATTLIIAPSSSTASFDDYLDVLAICERMLSDWGYTGVYQLASFHPDYQFDGEAKDSVANYTNRSPYPLFHLIRERDIARYMKNEDDAEKIYTHNIAKANELGCPYFEKALNEMRSAKNKNGL